MGSGQWAVGFVVGERVAGNEAKRAAKRALWALVAQDYSANSTKLVGQADRTVTSGTDAFCSYTEPGSRGVGYVFYAYNMT